MSGLRFQFSKALTEGHALDFNGYLTHTGNTNLWRHCCYCKVRYPNDVWQLNQGKNVDHGDHEKILVWRNHLDDAQSGIITGCFVHEKGQEHVRSHWEGQVVAHFAHSESEQRQLTEQASMSGSEQANTKKTTGKKQEKSRHKHGPESNCFAPPQTAIPRPTANFMFGTQRFGEPGPSAPSRCSSQASSKTRAPKPRPEDEAGPSGVGRRRFCNAIPDIVVHSDSGDEDDVREGAGHHKYVKSSKGGSKKQAGSAHSHHNPDSASRSCYPGPSSSSKAQASTSKQSAQYTTENLRADLPGLSGQGYSGQGPSGQGPWRCPAPSPIDLPDIFVRPPYESDEDQDEVEDDALEEHQSTDDSDETASPPFAINAAHNLLNVSSDEDDSNSVSPRAELYDFNSNLKIKYFLGKKEQFEALNISDVSYDQVLQSVLLNGMLVQLNSHWALLVSLMICLMGSKGIPLLMRQLCQLCFRPSFFRIRCGHCGLCVDCGGGDKDDCLQCAAIEDKFEMRLLQEYMKGEKIVKLSDGRNFVCEQRFFTDTLEDAHIVRRIMDIVQTRADGVLSQKDWKKIQNKLDSFSQYSLKILRKLNPLLNEIPFGNNDDQYRSLLFVFLLARTEIKCFTCPQRHQQPPMSRIVMRVCNHSRSCYDCVKENFETCLELNCTVHLKEGFTPIKHTVLPRR